MRRRFHWSATGGAPGVLCSLGLLGFLGSCSASDAPATPPHIVVLLVDDLGRGDVGFLGGSIATPRIDAFAGESIVLDRFYAAPMCSPARAQLMTGNHALTLGMTRNVKPRATGGLPEGVPTIAEVLARGGYTTSFVGKWHLGHATESQRPRARGFESSYGHMRGWLDYVTHEIDGIPDWHRDGVPLEEPGYTTDLIAREACRVIESHDASEPLFLFVSFNAPHTPLQAPPGAGPASTPRELYATMVEHMDVRIGDVLDALDAKGIADDTMVWFISDNGANPKYGGSNGDLKGGKYTCDEGGIRVPACVRWPGRVDPGSTISFVGTVDLAPTLSAVAGRSELQDVDGRDISPVLVDGVVRGDRRFLFAVDHANVQRRALLDGDYKLVEETRAGTTTRRFYNVARDPHEEHPLLTGPGSSSDSAKLEEMIASLPW